jgi:hypothetical protein
MKKMLIISLIIIPVLILNAFSFKQLAKESEVPYPEGYRNWVHIKTALIGPESPAFIVNGGYHHIYANLKAMDGYKTGIFPQGSVIVFDVLSTREHNGIIEEDSRSHIDVMVKDSLKFPETGGWGYEEFKGDSHTERKLTVADKTRCFTCHAKMSDYVFSEFRK